MRETESFGKFSPHHRSWRAIKRVSEKKLQLSNRARKDENQEGKKKEGTVITKERREHMETPFHSRRQKQTEELSKPESSKSQGKNGIAKVESFDTTGTPHNRSKRKQK